MCTTVIYSIYIYIYIIPYIPTYSYIQTTDHPNSGRRWHPSQRIAGCMAAARMAGFPGVAGDIMGSMGKIWDMDKVWDNMGNIWDITNKNMGQPTGDVFSESSST